MNCIYIYIYILRNTHLSSNNYCEYIDHTLILSLLGYNPDHNKKWLTVLFDVFFFNVSTLVNMVKTVLIWLMQSLVLDENKTLRQENNWIVCSSIDRNIKDWTDWYGLQPLLGEITDQIMSWWPVLPADHGQPSVIFRRNATT